MKSNHIPAKKLSFFEGKAGCQQVGTYGFFGFTQWGTKGAHTLRMKAASGKRTVQRLPLYIRAKKGGTDFKLFRYASNQDTVLLCLSLTHVKTVYGKFMVGLRKALTCLCPSFRIAKPLSSNCGTAMPDGDAETIKNTADGSDIHTPMEGKPSVAVHLREIPIFRGIQNIHAFNGFHSCFDFLRNTFFHNRYVLVEGKITKKKRETTVYNLSILNDESYVVPIGITHNCRCTVVQVLKDKYPVTPHDEAMALGEEATGKDTKGIFHFNPGIEQKTFPDYNPYTIRRCRDCDIAKGKLKLDFLPSNLLCDGCRYIHECYNNLEKSQSRVLKDHYMHEMEHLLNFAQSMPTKTVGETISVGFSKIGNEHLYSDTFGRSKVLRKEDLKSLDQLFANATAIDDNDAYGHKYNIEHFYYYQAELRGHKIRLNVAKEVRRGRNGRTRVKYYLYSINDIKE